MTDVRQARPIRRLVAIVGIGVMAAVLSACGPTPAPGPASGIVGHINAQRAANGLAPVMEDGGLAAYASNWAGYLSTIGALQHQGLGVPGWRAMGETLHQGACGQGDAEVVAAWMNSPPHRAILLSRAYSRVGVASVCSADGRAWSVADFGG